MSKNKKMLLSILVIYAVVIFLDLFLAKVTDNEEGIASEWATILISFGLAAYALRLYSREFIDSAQRMGRRSFIVGVALGVFLTLFFDVIGSAIWADITGALIPKNQELLNATAAALPFLAFIKGVVCAPIVEEVVFRYILQGWLREKIKKGGAFFAVLISGTLFALGHVATPADLLLYLPSGLLWGAIYEKERCISLTICIHSVINLIAFIARNML